MRRMRFLLQPGWLALLLGVLVFAGACFWLLSPWQFGRNSEREQQNAALTSALRTPAVPLAALPGDPVSTQWREIVVRGRYLQHDEVLARLRVVNGNPAYDVLTPLRADSGQVLLVNRGYVAADNGAPARYPAAPAGEVTVHARVHPDETGARAGQSLVADGKRQVYAESSATVSRVVGVPMRTGTYTLTDGQPGVLGVQPLPQIDSGPFLSYALQWIAFGIMALFGLGYFTWRELQPGGALTAEGRAARRVAGGRQPRGRKAVAAAIAADEADEAEREREITGSSR